MNHSYKISIYFSTRKRVKNLDQSLKSLFDLADLNNPNFEIIVKVDFDDHETINYITNWDNTYENLKFIISSRKKGYISLKEFSEYMIDLSQGEYNLCWNDDMIMKTPNWNNIFEKKLKEFKIYYPKVNRHREAFFVLPKKLKEILGYIGKTNSVDLYLHQLSELCNIAEYFDEVEYEHFWKDDDETFEDKKATFSEQVQEKQEFMLMNVGIGSGEYSQSVIEDSQKILTYLNNL